MNMLHVNCEKCQRLILVNQLDSKGPVCMSCESIEELNKNRIPLFSSLHPKAKNHTPVTTTNKPSRDMEELEKELQKAIQEMDENDMLDWEDMWEMDGGLSEWELFGSEPPRCECGAEKANTPFHSNWCPLYEDLFAKKDEDD